MLVVYKLPGPDCGSDSGGGAGSPDAYRTWIRRGMRSGASSEVGVLVVVVLAGWWWVVESCS
ncbi:glycoside hydrolase family 6 protein [Actinomadura sp. NBRC 104425]|uniref:glycoside hydrolase family 6 protein n=1 Tax=Actinomadura sp. NBRC 104425 TaxID=3032204 RepID=UPI0025540A5F|nr:glycoside hydrolase family 6 protein [Actinomadura sp. NBRC 104425]